MERRSLESLVDEISKGSGDGWVPAPAELACRFCKSAEVKCRVSQLGGPFSSAIRCEKCGMVESLYLNYVHSQAQGSSAISEGLTYEPDSEEGY